MLLHQLTVRKRLFDLLDTIICEEMSFQKNCLGKGLENSNLRKRHDEIMENLGCCQLERVQQVHQALSESHRKFRSEHELLIQRCMAVSRQARAGMLNNTEMALEVERLQKELMRVKQEHGQVEDDCRRILQSEGFGFGGSADRN